MKKATSEILYFETGRHNPATLRVMPGEEFEVQTQLNRGPWLEGHPDEENLRARLNDYQPAATSYFSNGWSIPWYLPAGLPSGNPSSGCIYIEEAQPGDMLCVHIGNIELDPLGFTNFRGNSGAVPSWFGPSSLGAQHRIVEIANGSICWSETLKLPARPMIGLIAVSPARERIANNWAGYWGGNLDVQEITTGATLMLGCNVEGGLLQIGDMHAIQGDGEICGAGGIEASGRVRLRVNVAKRPASMFWPRIENESHIAVIATARPLEDAFRLAMEGLVNWMEESYGFSRGEAFLLLGQVLEARCTAIVNPTYSYIAKISKKYLHPG
ncbi:MAG: acetamidase/formamidase family protein [Anaerolineales bacterium]|jgi:amidase